MSIGTTSNMEWLVGNGGGGSVEYTGGHGIDVDNANHIISVDQYEIQDKLTAGNNITITNNVISAADQVQADWTESNTSSKAYIAHKPTIPTATSDLTNDSNFITASEVPSSQVQADWNESDSSDPAYIANKPTIPSGDQLVPSATSSDEGKILTVDSNGDPSWVPAQTYSQVQSNWNETDSSSVSYIQNKPSIPTATSDLTNDSNFITASDVPSAQVQSDWTESDTSSAAYIAHKPSIPTATSDLTNDSNFITASDVPSAQVQSDWTEANTASAAYIAHKPTIPTVDQSYSSSSTNAQSGTAVSQAISAVNQVPSSTSADEGKVLTVDSNGDAAWATGGSVTQVQSDWTETDTTDASFIQNKPTTKPIAAGNGISVVEYADNVTITNTAAQVQSDWAESTATEPDYIKNKPTVKQIVAGANVTINESNSQITISSTGAGGVPVQADWTQADSNQPDYIKNKPTIPTAQVQSNWTEADTASKSFILNKPVTKPIVAGNGIVITETATEIVISLA